MALLALINNNSEFAVRPGKVLPARSAATDISLYVKSLAATADIWLPEDSAVGLCSVMVGQKSR